MNICNDNEGDDDIDYSFLLQRQEQEDTLIEDNVEAAAVIVSSPMPISKHNQADEMDYTFLLQRNEQLVDEEERSSSGDIEFPSVCMDESNDVLFSYYCAIKTKDETLCDEKRRIPRQDQLRNENGTTSYDVEVHSGTIDDINATLYFGDDGSVTTRKEGYLVEPPLVIEPSLLEESFILTSQVDGRLLFLVLPIEYSYAELWEVINDIGHIYQNEGCFRYENNNWTQFVKYMLEKIEKRKPQGSSIREKQVHYGYSGNSRVEGMRLHTVLTKEESIITNHTVRHGVKLLRLLKESGSSQEMEYEYDMLRRIGDSLLRLLKRHWKDAKEIVKDQMSMWEKAEYVTTFVENCKEWNKINRNIVGGLHTSASVGTGLSKTHSDKGNSVCEWGALPDFHVNITGKDDNIGFVVYVSTGKNTVRPIVVVQEMMACTYFYGATQRHGTIHMATYINAFNEHYRAHRKQQTVDIHDAWREPVMDVDRRIFVAYYTKNNLPMTAETVKAFKDIGMEPTTFDVKIGQGDGQDKKARAQLKSKALDEWEPRFPGQILTVTEMRVIQSDSNVGHSARAWTRLQM
jgi:hypothetical protein